MPRKCSICGHPEIDDINRALVDGQSFRNIAKRFNVSVASLKRHKDDHIPVTLAKAKEADQVAKAEDLLDQIRDLQRRTLQILNKSKDDRVSLAAIREARSNIDLLGQLLGKLDNSPKVAVLVANPEWLTIRAIILKALSPYQEARQAVAKALQDVSA